LTRTGAVVGTPGVTCHPSSSLAASADWRAAISFKLLRRASTRRSTASVHLQARRSTSLRGRDAGGRGFGPATRVDSGGALRTGRCSAGPRRPDPGEAPPHRSTRLISPASRGPVPQRRYAARWFRGRTPRPFRDPAGVSATARRHGSAVRAKRSVRCWAAAIARDRIYDPAQNSRLRSPRPWGRTDCSREHALARLDTWQHDARGRLPGRCLSGGRSSTTPSLPELFRYLRMGGAWAAAAALQIRRARRASSLSQPRS